MFERSGAHLTTENVYAVSEYFLIQVSLSAGQYCPWSHFIVKQTHCKNPHGTWYATSRKYFIKLTSCRIKWLAKLSPQLPNTAATQIPYSHETPAIALAPQKWEYTHNYNYYEICEMPGKPKTTSGNAPRTLVSLLVGFLIGNPSKLPNFHFAS